MNDKSLKIKGAIIQIQQNTTNSSQTITNIDSAISNDDFKDRSIKQTVLEKLQAIAIGASGNVIGEGILHFINLI